MRLSKIRVAMFVLGTWLPLSLFATNTPESPVGTDTLQLGLHEVEIKAPQRAAVSRLDAGVTRIDAGRLMHGIRRMGEADILNNIRQQAGVVTAGDYGAGLMIDGAEPSQTVCRIAGAPVFFPYRFGGIFSTFNTPHFRAAKFERGIHTASMPRRLGALIDFEPLAGVGQKAAGTVNAGLLSSSVTLKFPLPAGASLIASGRVSYVDELYGRLMHGRHEEFRYNFSDFNLTANCPIGRDNHINLNFFRSNDRLRVDDGTYALATRLTWNNTLASVSWTHRGRAEMAHRAYWSGFVNRLNLTLPQMWLEVPSRISVAGIAGDVSVAELAPTVDLDAGYEAGLYSNTVQTVELSGFGHERVADPNASRSATEARIYGDARLHPFAWVDVTAGLSLNYYRNGARYNVVTAEPRVSAKGRFGAHIVSVHAGLYGQNLHQTGFSEIGLSSDFWIAASKELPVERAFAANADYSWLWEQTGLRLTADAYVKLLRNQAEYEGQILDLIDADYSAESHIVMGRGYNAGINLEIEKETGRIVGAITAGYGVARRRYADQPGLQCGRTDPGFTLTARCCYRTGERWTLGADFRYGSGRPFTPVEAVYLISGNLISVYGPHNSRRLPAYHRLDLSATFRAGSLSADARVKHLINFSIINAYGHRNVEFRKYVINIKNGTFRAKEIVSLYRFLPSVSYTLQF